MTDNEIIKALKSEADYNCDMCCDNNENCMEDDCGKIISENALDLINRQKAEIEKLKNTDFQIEVSSRLEKEIRAEAIKEFAEKLKQQAFSCDVSFGFGKEHCKSAVSVIDIDNLLKEMTEGENG